jgi:putative transposase
MKQTLLVKLAPTADQHTALLRTLETFNAACNAIAAVAFAEQRAGKLDLQKLVYYDIRARFGLSSQMTIRAISKVSEAYKRDKAIQPHFRSHSAMVYDQRICSFPGPDRVSLLTLDGREVLPFRFGRYAEGMLQRVRGQCDLLDRASSNTFFLAITVDSPEPAPDEADEFLGVDLGIITLAATSDGELLNHATGPKHAHVNQVRARYSRFRQKLQQKGTQSAKRLLKKRSGREQRFARDVNHIVCRRLLSARQKAQDADLLLKTSRTSVVELTVPNASGECCTVGPSRSCVRLSPTKRRWLVCGWSTSIPPTPVRPVATAGIARKQTVPLKLVSFAGRAGSPPTPT